MEIYSRMFH